MAIITNMPTLNSDEGVWDEKLNQSLAELEFAVEDVQRRLASSETQPKFYVGSAEPADRSVIWIDTSVV